ncbi:MAG TPA: alpha/beta hydrolase [Patescibacteria group bacterium]|nr:alpha/beta hydrolase [Patescibacteria group bacterium]
MKQIFFFHGGNSWSSYDAYLENLKAQDLDYERLKPHARWREWIAEMLDDADVLLPTMPNGFNAQYDEWSIYFEKMLPFFGDDVRLVGHSLGAMFLVKYLSSRRLPAPVRQLILVAPGYNDNAREDLGSFEITSAKGLDTNTQDIHFFFSKDDPAIPFSECAKYQTDVPSAAFHLFEDRGHFLQSDFPEVLELLQQK